MSTTPVICPEEFAVKNHTNPTAAEPIWKVSCILVTIHTISRNFDNKAFNDELTDASLVRGEKKLHFQQLEMKAAAPCSTEFGEKEHSISVSKTKHETSVLTSYKCSQDKNLRLQVLQWKMLHSIFRLTGNEDVPVLTCIYFWRLYK